ncbi:MAG: SGNH/GDSL hydrolase family protein [Vicingaceae bacterium]|jgi:lysophospholipase L1-like esterase
MKKYKLLYLLPAALLFGCEPDIEDVSTNGGSADFSVYVAVGNSLTSGIQGESLTLEGQEYCYPNIIATQLEPLGGGEFKQPLLTGEPATEGVFTTFYPDPRSNLVLPSIVLKATPTGLAPVFPDPLMDWYSAPAFFENISAEGPYNNVGASGARVGSLNDPAFSSSNNWFKRFSSPGETVLEAAMKNNPTFFSLWIGANDVLGYSTSGGDESGRLITSISEFEADISEALDTLTRTGAKGVIANIPSVTGIAYFNTVPLGTILDAASANALTQGYADYNDALENPLLGIPAAEAAKRKITFTAGQFNFFIVTDTTLQSDRRLAGVPSIRQITSNEHLILQTPQDSLLSGWGTAKPIPGNYHINTDELKKINDATAEYNRIIKREADVRGLAHYDAYAAFNVISSTGIIEDGISLNGDYISGGMFSLDGVHPSTRGHAVAANGFIDAINAKYGSNIQSVSVSNYPSVEVTP